MNKILLDESLEYLIDYRGKTPKKTKSGIPLITAKIIKNGELKDFQEYISEEDFDDWMLRGIPQENDVCLTVEAPLGEIAQIPSTKVALAQRVITMRGKEGVLDNNYFKYYCMSKRFQNDLDSRATGTTVLGIKQSELRKISLSLIEYEDQIIVGKFLKNLDKKIRLNKKMNETLEEIAKRLFKSWFIDFDPVRAKTEGRPTGLSKEISDLFPDSFEDSELGEIPKDWKIKKISDIFEVKKGSTPATKNTEFWEPEEHKWVSPRDLSQNSSIFLFDSARGISKVGLQKIRSGLLPDNTVMMSSRAPIGLLGISGINFALGTGIFAIPPKNIMSYGLTYFFVGNQIRKLKQLSIGSTFEEVSLKIFNNLMIVFPNDEILTATKDIFDDFFKKIKTNTLEIKTLTNIRDTLLPKLISGELQIPDAENLIEEAGI